MRIFLYIAVFCVFFVLYVRLLENKTMFVPAKGILAEPTHAGMEFEDVYFKTQDGLTLNGWFIPAAQAKALILFCHGNAGNIGDRLGKIKIFHDLGLDVFIFDYRGYGRSEGSPTEQGMYRDALAAYDFLIARGDAKAAAVYLYGASLGGAAAIDLATKREVAGLIIDSSFSNAADMAQRIFPFIPSFLVAVKLDSSSKVKNIHKPSLYLHSIEDEMVPYDLGKKLFEAANEPKRFVELVGDHNDGHVNSEEIFVSSIREFIYEGIK